MFLFFYDFRSACLAAFVLFLCQSVLASSPDEPGTRRFSERNYVEYIVGDLPIILSAPHGGRKSPSSIPNRDYGTLVTDTNTDRLAEEIAKAFYERTGKYPHVVICHLKRVKVDCNRPIKEGAQGDKKAENAWHSFHSFIDEAKSEILKTHPRGLYVDLHAHGHRAPLVELGYLIRGRDLALPTDELDMLFHRSSIRELAERSDDSFSELIQGKSSFGAMLMHHDIKAVPSPKYPDPGAQIYFNGGYNTWRHGSRRGGEFNGFQAEIPYYAILSKKRARKRFVEAFVASTLSYLQVHEGITFNRIKTDKR